MMDYFFLAMLMFWLLFLATRPITTLLHELGHAIPAILFTKEKVVVYIGSYGDPSKSLKLNIGLLEIWLKFNPFSWRMGLCVPASTNMSIHQKIVFVLAGPIASVVLATAACYVTFSYDLHGSIKLFLVILLGSSIFDLYINLIPNTNPIQLYDGRLTQSDGAALKILFRLRKFGHEFGKAANLYQEKKYAEAAPAFDRILKTGIREPAIYTYAIASYMQLNNFTKAKELVEELIPLGGLNESDLINAGVCYTKFEQHTQAMELYEKALALNPDNKYALNNKGHTLNALGRYDEAIPLFDKAIEIDKTFDYAYNNRGLSKIKTGKMEDGLSDVKHSLELNEHSSHSYLHMGIYYLDKGDHDEALKLFIKAQALDPNTEKVDELIAEAQGKPGHHDHKEGTTITT